METDGAEDRAARIPDRAAVPPGKGRIPPRRPTTQQPPLQPNHVPPSEPQSRGEMERRLSFSSLQMMLDQHRTTTNTTHNNDVNNHEDAADNESLEEFFGEDDSLLNDDDEVEIDPGHLPADTDGREDTYSFIGADYSFGADRSLISLVPY
jgi:hypothetical protein